MSKRALLLLKEADRDKITARASVIYARHHSTPLDRMPTPTFDEYYDRAAVELWDEDALNFEPGPSEDLS